MMRSMRGMTFIDVVIGTALTLIIFLGLMGLLRASVLISAVSKQKGVATAIAESQLEYIRSLAYDSVGTNGGIPAGPVEQYATTTMNGTEYGIRTFIQYVDDPADGLDVNDENGIITDYKQIKVTVSYMAGGRLRTLDMISNYAPIGLETTTGGGTLRIVTVDALGNPVPGATVSITNTNTAPAVNLTAFSNASGIVYLPGAATSTDYQVSITKSGYSTAETYARDATNQNPTPGYLTVVKDQTTTGTFAIDQLASLTVSTYSPVATSTFTDSFADSSKIALTSNTAVSGGAVELASGGSGYALSGSVISETVSPTYLYAWSAATSTRDVGAGTDVRVRVVDQTGNPLPDAVLPGNGAGFIGDIDLSDISTTTYPSLALSADLSTNSTTTTPYLRAWTLSYLRGPVPLPNISFSLTGGKTIGSTGAGAPIYKTTVNTATDATGVKALTLEWDSYAMTLNGYDTVDACNAPPYVLAPAANQSSALYLSTATSNSLLVTVKDSAGVALKDASVEVSRTGYAKTVMTSACGGAYFGSLTANSDYTITVSKSGYTTDILTNMSVSGHTFITDTL